MAGDAGNQAPAGQVLLYRSEDGRTKLDVRLEQETVWLSQRQLTDLFGKAKGTISEHIKHIFEDGELVEESVVRLFRTTGPDGKVYEVAHYNIDMVLAGGFRVRSASDVRFRQWAAERLKEYVAKGFVLDDERFGVGPFVDDPERALGARDDLLARARPRAAALAPQNSRPRRALKGPGYAYKAG